MIKKYETYGKNSVSQVNKNLTKGVGFFTFLSTSSVDFGLSINGKYMKRKTYENNQGCLTEKDTKIYVLVEGIMELDRLKRALRWKRISAECDVYQGNKYALYFLADETGKNTGYYKVIKLEKIIRGRSEPEEVNYYKRVVI